MYNLCNGRQGMQRNKRFIALRDEPCHEMLSIKTLFLNVCKWLRLIWAYTHWATNFSGAWNQANEQNAKPTTTEKKVTVWASFNELFCCIRAFICFVMQMSLVNQLKVWFAKNTHERAMSEVDSPRASDLFMPTGPRRRENEKRRKLCSCSCGP